MTTIHNDAQSFAKPVTFAGAVEFTGSVQMPGGGPLFTTNPETGTSALVGTTYILTAHCDTTVGATARVVSAPVPADGYGEVIEVLVACDVQIATGSLVVTPNINGSNLPTAITITSGAVAHSVRSELQTGTNPSRIVQPGDTVRAAFSGANTGNGRATVQWVIKRRNPGE